MKLMSWMLFLAFFSNHAHAELASGIPQYRWACGDMSDAECRALYAPQQRQTERQPEPRRETGEERIARQIVEQTNQERRAKGLHPLRVDPLCTAAMNDHVIDMAARSYLSHTGRNGSDPSIRYQRHSRNRDGAGENIAYNMTGTASSFMKQWINSPGHYANIVRGSYSHIGVSVREGKCPGWSGGQTCYYAGQCFSRPSGR